jgi:hypothetical protein
LPSCLDDYVGEDNPARVIDVFVDELDLDGLGFAVTPAVTGRPSYHPATLLKLYIYRYLKGEHVSPRASAHRPRRPRVFRQPRSKAVLFDARTR